jgi:hypothetical protein
MINIFKKKLLKIKNLYLFKFNEKINLLFLKNIKF